MVEYVPAQLQDDLQTVQQAITDRLAERPTVRDAVVGYLQDRGGPPVRAALTLLCAGLGRYQLEAALHSAAAVELIHGASVAHDTLLDPAERRAGTVSKSAEFDGPIGLMIGDYLFALAASEMALAPDPQIISFFSQAVMAIAEAQLQPVNRLQPLETALADYQVWARDLTGALFAAACKAGAVCGELDADQTAALGEFGSALGIAYQMALDARQFDVPSELPRGLPLSLPLILAAETDSETVSALLNSTDSAERAGPFAQIRASGYAEQAQHQARSVLAEALGALDQLATSHARAQLAGFARQLIG